MCRAFFDFVFPEIGREELLPEIQTSPRYVVGESSSKSCWNSASNASMEGRLGLSESGMDLVSWYSDTPMGLLMPLKA
ncbi:MAG: hypothetical protein ACJAQT_003148 [Akkermansiaceae bacterium]